MWNVEMFCVHNSFLSYKIPGQGASIYALGTPDTDGITGRKDRNQEVLISLSSGHCWEDRINQAAVLGVGCVCACTRARIQVHTLLVAPSRCCDCSEREGSNVILFTRPLAVELEMELDQAQNRCPTGVGS